MAPADRLLLVYEGELDGGNENESPIPEEIPSNKVDDLLPKDRKQDKEEGVGNILVQRVPFSTSRRGKAEVGSTSVPIPWIPSNKGSYTDSSHVLYSRSKSFNSKTNNGRYTNLSRVSHVRYSSYNNITFEQAVQSQVEENSVEAQSSSQYISTQVVDQVQPANLPKVNGPPLTPASEGPTTPMTGPSPGGRAPSLPPRDNAPRPPAPPPPPPRSSAPGPQGPPTPPPPPSNAPRPPGTPAPPPPPRNAPRPPGTPGPPPPPSNAPRPLGTPSLIGRPSGPKLKPLYWTKIFRALPKSMWEEFQKDTERSPTKFDVMELEELFSAEVPGKNIRIGERPKTAGSKADKIHLLDIKRSNNIEIMLTKIKMPLPHMMAAALAMDETILDVDQVENLIKFCPTEEEIKVIKNYEGDTEMLGKSEQFVLELMKVPNVKSKLEVFLFKIQFNSQTSEFTRILNTINSATDEVRASVKLKDVIWTILSLGNHININTPRGTAVAFKLESLLILSNTRTSDNKMTLMHYLCKFFASNSPALLDFHVDLFRLESATKIQFKSLSEKLEAIKKELDNAKQELTASEEDGPVSEVFRKTLGEFVGLAETKVTSLTNLHSKAVEYANELAVYFGENTTPSSFEQVTSTLLQFVKLFRKAHEENHKWAELEKKKAKTNMKIEMARRVSI